MRVLRSVGGGAVTSEPCALHLADILTDGLPANWLNVTQTYKLLRGQVTPRRASGRQITLVPRNEYARPMRASRVFAIVLAGGEGKRLMPLTADRAKPAVPFGGNYRLIDFALSNLVNAGYLQDRRADAVQEPQPRPARHDRLAAVAAARQLRDARARPAAARPAVVPRLGRRHLPDLNLLDDERPNNVGVVGADHVFRMDFAQMVDAAGRAGIRAAPSAGIRQPIEKAASSA